MAKVSPLMLAPIGIFAAFVAMAAVGMFRENPNELPSTRVGGQATALTEAQLSEFPSVGAGDLARGEVTLVNFWASWCPPCRAEHPKLLEMAAEGIPIIGVNFRDTEGPASSYLDGDGNPFVAIAFDPAARSAIDWGVTARRKPSFWMGTALYCSGSKVRWWGRTMNNASCRSWKKRCQIERLAAHAIFDPPRFF